MIKRDIRYVIKKILIGVGIILVMSFIKSCNVHAETFEITSNTTINNYNLPVYYVLQNSGSLVLKYQDYQYYSGTPFNSNFGYMSVCSTGNFDVNNNSADCSDGCYNNSFPVVNLGTNCNYSSGNTTFNGTRYYIFYSVKTWGSLNAGTLPIVYDTITFKNKTTQNIQLAFESNFISNEDVYNEYAGSNRIAELQEETNRIIQESNQSVINNQNTNTQSIINNQNQNAQDIMNNDTINTDIMMQNDNQNTQDIIDNQNANSQAEIESQKVCTNNTLNYNDTVTQGALNINGGISNYTNWRVTDYISLDNVKTINLINIYNAPGNAYCFYNINKVIISCFSLIPDNANPNIPDNAYYARFSIRDSNQPQIQLEICKNGNQALSDSINDTNDTLKDNTIEDPSGDFADFQNMLATNGVITELITLPISLFTNILNSINGTCSPFILGELMGTNLTIPCINISDYLGSFLWNVIDILFSGFFVYTVSKKMIKVFENMTSLKESDDLE